MKKRIFNIIIIVTLLLFSSCQNEHDQQSTLKFNSSLNGVEIGTSPEQLIEELDEKGIELVPPNESIVPDNIEAIHDGREYNTANEFFTYKTTNGMVYQYDEDGKLRHMITDNPGVTTDEGFKVGNTKDEMISLYGGDYTTFSDSPRICEYYNGSEYLIISFENDYCIWWMLSAYSYPDN